MHGLEGIIKFPTFGECDGVAPLTKLLPESWEGEIAMYLFTKP